MPAPHELSTKALSALRRQGGVLTSAELQELLGVSQPTVSRALAPLIHAGQVQKVGAARSQRYVLPRNVPGVGSEVRVMRIDAQGRPSPFARLVPLEGGAFWVDEADGVSARHDGLPWFLDDMRPQGFMGRTFAHAHPELQLGHNPLHWSDDDVLRAMTLYGDDLPGNLIMGEAAFQRFHTLPTRASRVASAADYPQLAEQAMRGTHPGSSAGGEQPKFCTITAGRHVIVKFSPAGDAPADQRMRDLLVCEHLALACLREAGLPAAESELVDAGGHTCLEVRRFDRTPDVLGRRGHVSLLALDAAFAGGDLHDWGLAGDRLVAAGWIDPDTATRMACLHWFGRLIGNSDMHFGNLGFHLTDAGPLAIAPAYDMLPMSLAPSRTGAVRAANPLRPNAPERAGQISHLAHAADAAIRFWEQVAASERIQSAELRQLATLNREAVARFARAFRA